MLELNRLYNMDCMDGMALFPDKYFDLAVVDPPYGIGVTKMHMGSRNNVRPSKKTWDDATPDESYFQELFRVSQNQIIFGGNYFDLPPTRGFLIWDKGESLYGRSFAECEYAWTSFDASARIFRHTPVDPARIHPTQKPVALYSWLLRLFAQRGDKIIDTHAGSASSLVACHKSGLEFVGFEIDADHYAPAQERLDAAMAQMSLFDLTGGGVVVFDYRYRGMEGGAQMPVLRISQYHGRLHERNALPRRNIRCANAQAT